MAAKEIVSQLGPEKVNCIWEKTDVESGMYGLGRGQARITGAGRRRKYQGG